MPQPDYYALLEIEISATPAEIKQAYYRQAKKYHPDLNAGDAVAEDRFKLVAEAYRILGDEYERRLYDEARERDIRYAATPELASMPRVARFSMRRGRSRDSRREKHVARRRYGGLPRRKKMSRWVSFIMVVFWLSALAPFVLRMGSWEGRRSESATAPEKTEPPDDVVRERLARMRAELEQAAAAGDSRAQLRLGLLLYTGSAGVQLDRPAAQAWWRKAAAQGNKTAASFLEKCDFTQPVPEPAAESAPQAESD